MLKQDVFTLTKSLILIESQKIIFNKTLNKFFLKSQNSNFSFMSNLLLKKKKKT